KMSWGNCSVKVSCPHGDFHDEPEGTAPGRLGQSRALGAHYESPRRHGPASDHPAIPARLKRRFESGGAPALRHRSRGQPSPRRLPPKLRAQIAKLMTTTYLGFNDVHLTEKLREVHGPMSAASRCGAF